MFTILGIATELRRLAEYRDIPSYRRRQMLALADEIDPPARLSRKELDRRADAFAEFSVKHLRDEASRRRL